MKLDVLYLLECYTGEAILKVSEDQERSSEPNEYQNQSLAKIGCSDEILQMINGIARDEVALNAHQRHVIRDLARSLKTVADSLQVRPPRSLLAIERAILQNEGLNADEMQVVNNIHSIRTTTTVSNIVECLGENLTSHTVRAALRFLCYSASSISEELAFICELTKLTYPRIQQLTRCNSIYDEINKYIEDRLNNIIH